jgi:predicted RNA binding protein YcfA (HicA-like mRNA interferase family)
MPWRKLTIHELRRILASFDVEVARQRGSHIVFAKQFPDGRFTYPVPVHGKDVLDCYVRGCRKKFRLTEEDGVTDDAFYSR